MKRKRIELLAEQDVLTGFIVSDKFCNELIEQARPEYFELDYGRILVSWILDYYNQYGKAPKDSIQKIYRENCSRINDEDLQDNLLAMIKKLSSDFAKGEKTYDEEYLIDSALAYLETRAVMVLAERIVDNAEIGEREKARTLIRGFAPLQRNRNQVTSVTKDDKKIIAALMSEQDFLFQFSGALGRVCGKFNRQDFVAFLGSYKSGKSWYLQYTAEEAARAGYKVLFISLEMSETDMIKRFWSSLAGYTPDSDSIEVPYFEEGENEKFFVSKKKIKRKRTLIDSRTLRDKQKLFRQYFRGGDIRIAPFAAGVAGLSDVLATIDDYERVQNYTPDIIVVDYADLLVDASRGEYRQNLDKVWRRLRGLAQERDCLVVTASQATRQAIGKKVSLATVAEDSRKIGHVTAMIGLNRQTQWEKNNLIGISQLAVRSGRREFRQAMVIYSYEMGRVVLDNKFEDEIDFEEEKEEQKVPIKRQRKKQAS